MSQEISQNSNPLDNQNESPHCQLFVKKVNETKQQIIPQTLVEEETPRTCYESARQTLYSARTRSHNGQFTQRSATTQSENTESRKNISRTFNQDLSDEKDYEDLAYHRGNHQIEEVKDYFPESLDDIYAENISQDIKQSPFPDSCFTHSQLQNQMPALEYDLNENPSPISEKDYTKGDSYKEDNVVLGCTEQHDPFEPESGDLNRKSLDAPSKGNGNDLSAGGTSGSYSMDIFNNISTVQSISISTQSKNMSKRSFLESPTNSNEVSSIISNCSSLQIRYILSSSIRGKTYMVKYNDGLAVLKRFEMITNKSNLELLKQFKQTQNLLRELNLKGLVQQYGTYLPKTYHISLIFLSTV